MNEDKVEKMLQKERYNQKFLGIIVSVHQSIWTLAASNFKWTKVSYSAYGQTASVKIFTMKTLWFET